jgi:catechol 2,3-dioxygenase-like lactoylglutathione lyase family enzyme
MSEPTAVLNQLNIVVRDIRASADFYRRLGARIPEPPVAGGNSQPFHAECDLANEFHLDLDSTDFAEAWNSGWVGRDDLAGRVVIGFRVETRDRVDEIYAGLTDAGHRGLQPPWDAFWGARYAIIEDPNGIAVGLMSPIDPARRYWPPKNWKP